MQRQEGKTLTEILVTVAMIGMVGLIGISAIDYARTNVALAAGTSELRALFQRVRELAVAHDCNVAIRFRADGESWSWSIYEDGDGDGVRGDDIAHGIDREIERPRRFQHAPVRIGVPWSRVIDPTTGRPLATRLPVRFGSSSLCSFSRNGEATTGSVVLTDGVHVRIIRILGDSARINVLRWTGSRWVTGV